tara:strand:+ start:1738 stop:1950 length:213 start_codon:yes stop_codon:yes gene_type:complete
MIDTPDSEGPRVGLNLDERAVRALSTAVNYTLEKWAGDGFIDQEELLNLKPFLQGAVLEFNLYYPTDRDD